MQKSFESTRFIEAHVEASEGNLSDLVCPLFYLRYLLHSFSDWLKSAFLFSYLSV